MEIGWILDMQRKCQINKIAGFSIDKKEADSGSFQTQGA